MWMVVWIRSCVIGPMFFIENIRGFLSSRAHGEVNWWGMQVFVHDHEECSLVMNEQWIVQRNNRFAMKRGSDAAEALLERWVKPGNGGWAQNSRVRHWCAWWNKKMLNIYSQQKIWDTLLRYFFWMSAWVTCCNPSSSVSWSFTFRVYRRNKSDLFVNRSYCHEFFGRQFSEAMWYKGAVSLKSPRCFVFWFC